MESNCTFLIGQKRILCPHKIAPQHTLAYKLASFHSVKQAFEMQANKTSDKIAKDDELVGEADNNDQETPTKPLSKTTNKRAKKASPQKGLVVAPVAKFAGNELIYNSLLIFMNHPSRAWQLSTSKSPSTRVSLRLCIL